MSDYTPSRIEVLCRFQEWALGSSSDTVREAEFNRWLSAYRDSVLEESVAVIARMDDNPAHRVDMIAALRGLKSS